MCVYARMSSPGRDGLDYSPAIPRFLQNRHECDSRFLTMRVAGAEFSVRVVRSVELPLARLSAAVTRALVLGFYIDDKDIHTRTFTQDRVAETRRSG